MNILQIYKMISYTQQLTQAIIFLVNVSSFGQCIKVSTSWTAKMSVPKIGTDFFFLVIYILTTLTERWAIFLIEFDTQTLP